MITWKSVIRSRFIQTILYSFPSSPSEYLVIRRVKYASLVRRCQVGEQRMQLKSFISIVEIESIFLYVIQRQFNVIYRTILSAIPHKPAIFSHIDDPLIVGMLFFYAYIGPWWFLIEITFNTTTFTDFFIFQNTYLYILCTQILYNYYRL